MYVSNDNSYNAESYNIVFFTELTVERESILPLTHSIDNST